MTNAPYAEYLNAADTEGLIKISGGVVYAASAFRPKPNGSMPPGAGSGAGVSPGATKSATARRITSATVVTLMMSARHAAITHRMTMFILIPPLLELSQPPVTDYTTCQAMPGNGVMTGIAAATMAAALSTIPQAQ